MSNLSRDDEKKLDARIASGDFQPCSNCDEGVKMVLTRDSGGHYYYIRTIPQAAHDALLGELVKIGSNFIGPSDLPTNIQRGSLGEFIVLRIARSAFKNVTQIFAPNAINPLNSASIPGLDLTYLLFHATDEKLDLAFIQEVKTTGAASLAYADNLRGRTDLRLASVVMLGAQEGVRAHRNCTTVHSSMRLLPVIRRVRIHRERHLQ